MKKTQTAATPQTRAKRYRLRAPNEKVRLQIERCRELRVKNEQIQAIRLQKALVLAGLGARRAMDQVIAEGRVEVNGQIATLGMRVTPEDKIRVDGKAVFVRWPDRLPRVLVYHKQEGEMVTRDDPKGRVTVFARLPQTHSSRWTAVGRLDVNTSGLLIFTTSGELANRMTHPRFEVEREYAVRVLGEVSDAMMAQLMGGVELEDGWAKFDRITRQQSPNDERANQWFRVVLHEGRHREVRRLFEAVGVTVSRLMRVRFGMVHLPSRLKRGQFHELDAAEVAAIVKWAGLAVNGEAQLEKRPRPAKKPRTQRQQKHRAAPTSHKNKTFKHR